MRTLEEIMERLKTLDEITLLEMLNVSSEDLIDRFRDIIEDNPEKFNLELEQWEDNDPEEN